MNSEPPDTSVLDCLSHYSLNCYRLNSYCDLPNNRAGNLIIFWQKKNTYKTLLGPTHLLISEIFPSKPDFHLSTLCLILLRSIAFL